VAQVFGVFEVNGIFADVRSEIADAFEGADDEDEAGCGYDSAERLDPV